MLTAQSSTTLSTEHSYVVCVQSFIAFLTVSVSASASWGSPSTECAALVLSAWLNCVETEKCYMRNVYCNTVFIITAGLTPHGENVL